jgi:diguanylate cyclase (GGDEF)-like protein
MGRQIIPFVGFLCLLPCLLFPQSRPFQLYGLQDGLPQSQITCLAQDHEGYVWAGTQGGLIRFNGERFIPYFGADGLPSARVTRMLVDRSGILWIATQRGLAKWQDHRLTAVTDQAVAKKSCRALAEDGRGNIWVGTHQGLAVRRNGVFLPVNDGPGRSLGMVYDLIAAADGVMGVSVNGLFRAGSDGGPAVKLDGPPAPESSLRSLARTAEGLWVSSSQLGLFLQDGRKWAPVPQELVKARTIYWMWVAPSGAFYIASRDGGLFRRLRGDASFDVFNASNGLPSNLVNCALEDGRGTLWVGTDIGGLARLRSILVANFGRADGLPDDCVFGITPAGRKDEAWFGSMSGAVRCRLDHRLEVLERISSQNGLSDNHVWKVITAPGGEVWAMTDNSFHRRAPGQARFETLSKSLPIPHQEIYGLTLDGQGRVWLSGTDSAAPLALRDASGQWRSWNRSAEDRTILQCRATAARSAGGVWAAADGRILACDGLTVHETPDPLPIVPGTTVDVVFEDSRGRLWAGYDGGVVVHESGRGWRAIRSGHGLNFNQVYFIGGDSSGTIWIGTSNGTLRITAAGRMEPFSLAEGLAGLEANQDAFYQAPDGSVWIGTVDGVSRVDAASLKPSSLAPPVMLEAAELPGRTLPFPRRLDLSWKERVVTFRVAVLNYGAQGDNLYRVRLLGMETDWTVTRQSGLRYTNIPPGRYDLAIQPAVQSGGWGPVLATPVTVGRPYWLTWWFRLVIIVLLAAAIGGIFLWRTRLLRERAEQLKRTVTERTEELLAANQELERLATHDPLTGLWNRRVVLDRLAAACRAEPGGSRPPFALVIVDIDDFKKVNDELGHVAGDTVLRDVAQQIEAQTRQADVVGRYGGDEFLIILDGADKAAVESVVRRIANLAYVSSIDGRTVTVTASCGALALEGEGPVNEVALLARVDQLLYETKKMGKHRYLIETLKAGPPRPR